MSCGAKTDEPIKMPFGVRTRVAQKNTDPPEEGATVGEHPAAHCEVQRIFGVSYNHSLANSSDVAFRSQYCSNFFIEMTNACLGKFDNCILYGISSF